MTSPGDTELSHAIGKCKLNDIRLIEYSFIRNSCIFIWGENRQNCDFDEKMTYFQQRALALTRGLSNCQRLGHSGTGCQVAPFPDILHSPLALLHAASNGSTTGVLMD